MRSISHCANHPSREALHRCGSCGTWVCERCVREHSDRIFCSRRCLLRHDVRTVWGRAKVLFGAEVPPAWSIGLTTAVCVLVAAAIGSLVGQVLQLSTPVTDAIVEVAVPVAPPPATGHIVSSDSAWRLEVQGAPDSTVLVEVGDEPVAIVKLDGRGRGVIDSPSYPRSTADVRVSVLSGPPALLGTLPAATPTDAEPEPEPPVIARALATAMPVVTETPIRVSSPTATPTPTGAGPSPTAVATQPPTTMAASRSGTPTVSDAEAARSAPPVLHLVPDAGSRLALTFDGAVSSNGTADLLDVLRSLNVSVTIFVTGEFIEKNPGIVRRAALAGHEFGNHTFSHPHLTTYSSNHRHDLRPQVTRQSLQDELRRTEDAFRRATGRSMAPFWRAPFGEENSQLRGWAMELGYLHVRWSSLQGASLDSLDWVEDEHSPLYVNPQGLVQRLLAFPKLEGGIVLMHLSTKRRVPPWAELPQFASEVRSRGLEIGPVSELLKASPTWRPWYEQALARHREIFEQMTPR